MGFVHTTEIFERKDREQGEDRESITLSHMYAPQIATGGGGATGDERERDNLIQNNNNNKQIIIILILTTDCDEDGGAMGLER